MGTIEDPESTPEKGPWKITMDIPSYLPMILHYPGSELREKLYRAYVTKASSGDNGGAMVFLKLVHTL